jgi:NAD(P)-dependent dehydrogenase (short-subunit alcohol dehydrogenase family)
MTPTQRTYAVTGAASGIGKATTAMLESIGHRVIGVDRHDVDVIADLSTSDGRRAMVSQIAALTDHCLDAVVACAGTVGQGATDVRVNYFGALATLEGLRPFLQRGTEPRAVAVTSFAVIEAVDDRLVDACLAGDEPAARACATALVTDPLRVYASSKRALARWIRRAAPHDHWAGCGIALNAVAPGIVQTPMTEPILAHPELRETLLATVPMPFGGVTTPEGVAKILTFLTDPDLPSVTGQLLFIDGGGDCVRRGDSIWS